MDQARQINTAADVEAVLASPAASFAELMDCVSIARREERWDLQRSAAERAFQQVDQRQQPHAGDVVQAAEVLVRSILRGAPSLDALPASVEQSQEVIRRARGALDRSRAFTERLVDEDSLAEMMVLCTDASPESRVRLSSRLRKFDRADLAVDSATLTVEADAASAPALTSRGAAYCDLGNYGRATLDLRAALEMEPTSTYALVAISRVMQADDRLPEALDFAERAVELEPENRFALHRQFAVIAVTGDAEDMEDARDRLKALPAGSSDRDRWIDLLAAEVLVNEGKLELAGKILSSIPGQSMNGEIAKRYSKVRKALKRTRSGRQQSLDLGSDT